MEHQLKAPCFPCVLHYLSMGQGGILEIVFQTKGGMLPNSGLALFVVIYWLNSVRLFWDLKDCSPPGSSVLGIFQARILRWVAISFSGGSSRLKRWNLCLLHWQADSFPLSQKGGFNFKGECQRKTNCFNQESQQSKDKVDSCPETNSEDCLAMIVLKVEKGREREESQWITEAGVWILHHSP